MEQFSLEKYLENPSRKVVTRRGNPVRIICTDRKHGEDNLPIVFLEQCHNGEFLLACRKDGRGDTYDTPYDLFFADKEEGLTEFEKADFFNEHFAKHTMEYKKEFKVSEITDIKPSKNSHKEIYEWVKKKMENLPYAPWQLKPDSFIPDLSDDAQKYHWGCPPPKNNE